MDTGYIKLHRKMTEWEWYKDSNTFVVFMHLLFMANWKDSRFMGCDVPRGSLVTSLAHLAEDCNLSVKSVRTALEHLKSTGEVTIKTTNKFSLLTVTNYGLYQDDSRQEASQTASESANKGQSIGNQRATIEEYKERKNINNNITLPFESENFKSAWERWKKFRTEIKHKLTPSTEASQLKKLAKCSEDEAIAMIEQSIEHGWQGLFPIRKYNSPIQMTKQGLTGFLSSIDDIEF